MAKRKSAPTKKAARAANYQHPEANSPMRPDVGTQAQFKKKKPPKTYRYDSSLAPEMQWDEQNPAREQGEALIAEIAALSRRLTLAESDKQRDKLAVQIQAAAEKLKAMSGPFLNWAGKAERLSFDVPTLPLFVHERLSTKAIIETLTGHQRQPAEQQGLLFDLFGDPEHPVADQVLRAYEYQDQWVNRMILGDSLVVMNSLLHYENLGGQVQMIYMDPPYGVKFGSNFQPFVHKRDVKHNDDTDMTREPEMVQAYRDTWELGLHSYLTYLRDRLLLCRDLLHPSGSMFVQMNDENVDRVRAVMDEVSGIENFVGTINLKKTTSASGAWASNVSNFRSSFAKEHSRLVAANPSVPQCQGTRADNSATGTSRVFISERVIWQAVQSNYSKLRMFARGRSERLDRSQRSEPGRRPPRINHNWPSRPRCVPCLTRLAKKSCHSACACRGS